MDRRDDLASMITERIQLLSSGIDEKINNAALQTKVVTDLSSAVRVHLSKFSDIAMSGGDPQAVIQALASAAKSLESALLSEESRVRTNYDTLVARRHVLQEVGGIIDEEIDSHQHWQKKKVELQERHLAGENLLKPKKGQHPESVRDVRNALEDLPEPEPIVEPEPEPAVEPEPVRHEDVDTNYNMDTNQEVLDESQDEQELPQHVSRFFSGE